MPFPSFFWLTPEVRRVLKIIFGRNSFLRNSFFVLGKWASLQHMISWILAMRGARHRPIPHEHVQEGSLVR